MLALAATLSIVLCQEPPVTAITPDGGEVPTVAPKAVDDVAPVLAPERVPDGGVIVVPSPSLSVYTVDLPLEISATAASGLMFVVVDTLMAPTMANSVACKTSLANGRCDPVDLTGLDRYSVGRVSREWSLFSDITLAATIVAPVLYLALESITLPTTTPWRDFLSDTLIVAESLTLTSAFQLVLKFAFRRPRPIQYTMGTEPLTDVDTQLSFPSGHVMLVGAATTALTTTIFFRHPKSPIRFVALASGILLTALTALARVEGGHHFPTDVFVGGLLGGFAGLVVPYLHRIKLPVQPLASVDPITGASSVGVRGSF